MALQGTHIRFALDLQDLLAISDFDAYISGTIYPDSRYFTNLDRELTHPRELIADFLRADDFRKGWAVHMICDRMQREITEEHHPEIFAHNDEMMYVCATACKILQDIRDTSVFDITQFVHAMKVVETPNGESSELLGNFYARIRGVYELGGAMTSARLLDMFNSTLDFGDVVKKIRVQCADYENSGEIESLLDVIYPEMLARARKLL